MAPNGSFVFLRKEERSFLEQKLIVGWDHRPCPLFDVYVILRVMRGNGYDFEGNRADRAA